MSRTIPTNHVDPVYYDSTPWLFYLVEIDIFSIRSRLDDPQRSSIYCSDIHRTQIELEKCKTFVDLSKFVQMKHSTWSVCFFSGRFDMLFRCKKKNAIEMERYIAEYMSRLFKTRVLLFGYHDPSDTIYYEMFEQGFWSESFYDSMGHDKMSFQSATNSEPASKFRDIWFIEDRFKSLNIFVPWPELYNEGENQQIVKGRLAEGSIFSENDVQGFDCALLHCL